MARPVVTAAMQTLAAGNPELSGRSHRPASGFTLLELLVVLALVAFVSAGVGFSMRDGTQTQLEREALRLSALLESARARSQVSGVPVRWRVTADGFQFDGLPPSERPDDDLPQVWLDADTTASVDMPATSSAARPSIVSGAAPSDSLLLGPEPILGPQSVSVVSRSQPAQRVRLASDGVRPFAVRTDPP